MLDNEFTWYDDKDFIAIEKAKQRLEVRTKVCKTQLTYLPLMRSRYVVLHYKLQEPKNPVKQ